MSTPHPITVAEMAGLLQRTVNAGFAADIAYAPDDNSFEMIAPATGQRFRITVEEVPAWTDAMDRELERVATP
jgi:hypothetical protein